MALILARSPYFITRQGFDDNASLTLDLQLVDSNFEIVLLKTYTFSFRLQTAIDVSPFIRDYLIDNKVVLVKATVNGNLSGVPQTAVVENHIATDGYSYFEEGYNKNKSADLINNALYAGSNNLLQFNKNSFLRIPFLNPYPESADEAITKITINVYDSIGVVLQTVTKEFLHETNFTLYSFDTSERISYILIGFGSYDNYFENRVLADLGIFESSNCLITFIDDLNIKGNVTRIEIIGSSDEAGVLKTVSIPVETIEECKYEPKEVHFVNRYGVEETFWFFKKNTKSITVEKETYRPNIIDSYQNGNLTHQYQNYNVNGREKITLNTGFVNESFSENIKQLMLSESVWMYDNGIKRPMNVSTSEMELRTHVNDKLINYTVEFEFSNDIINNVG